MIIKLGSTQKEHVKEIQEALDIWVDGDFGSKTEAAVKKFQKENGLDADGIVGLKTYAALMQEDHKYTLDQIKHAVISKGHEWFEDGDYNINIVGVRNKSVGDRVTNKFDDHITVSYKANGEWKFHCYEATTDPGDDWMDRPMNKKGCAILVPGQYKGSHKLRLHAGKYLALGQQKNVKVYRDRNKDGKYDFDASTITEGLYGINVHRATGIAGKTSSRINKWSAGCQVIASNNNWHTFLDICQTARDTWSNNFTYTLIDSTDINS